MTSRRANQILPATYVQQASVPASGAPSSTASVSQSVATSTSDYWQPRRAQAQHGDDGGDDDEDEFERDAQRRGVLRDESVCDCWRWLSPVRFSARDKLHAVLAALVALATLLVLLAWVTRPTSGLQWRVTPSELSFPVVASRFGESCFEACKRVDMQCQAQYFPLLNDCVRLRKYLGYPATADCSAIEGYDLPAYDRAFNRLHTLKRGSPYTHTCGASHTNTKRACPCVARKAARVQRSVHVVYSTEVGHYMHWQALYMHHWFKQIDWPNAKLTRLLSGGACDDLCNAPHSVPTHVVPEYNNSRDRGYKPYNKPFGVMHWLAHAKPDADVIVVVDPDCMFNRAMDFVELVETNRPIAQKAFFTFAAGSVDKRVIDRFSMLTGKFCEDPEPAAVPYILTRDDMRRVVPLWLKYTEVVRSDRHAWPDEWTDMPGVPWIAEMLGYVLATCELGMKHQIWPELQLVPGVNWTSLGEPLPALLHYHTPVWANGHKWVKYPEDAATNFPWPLSDDMGPVEKYFFKRFHNASKTLFDLPAPDFVWRGSTKQFRQ